MNTNRPPSSLRIRTYCWATAVAFHPRGWRTVNPSGSLCSTQPARSPASARRGDGSGNGRNMLPPGGAASGSWGRASIRCAGPPATGAVAGCADAIVPTTATALTHVMNVCIDIGPPLKSLTATRAALLTGMPPPGFTAAYIRMYSSQASTEF